MQGLEELELYLKHLAPGEVSPASIATIANLLARSWSAFLIPASNTKKVPDRLIDQIDHVRWNPPLLKFEIRSDSSTTSSAANAPVDSWAVNLNTHEASIQPDDPQSEPVEPDEKPFDVKLLAQDVARSIVKDKRDSPFEVEGWSHSPRTYKGNHSADQSLHCISAAAILGRTGRVIATPWLGSGRS